MGNRLLVGGLSWDTNDDGLRAAFSHCGQLDDVRVMTDRYTGRSRGFGFITFASSGDASRALEEMHGTMLDGRSLVVSEARERASGGRR